MPDIGDQKLEDEGLYSDDECLLVGDLEEEYMTIQWTEELFDLQENDPEQMVVILGDHHIAEEAGDLH